MKFIATLAAVVAVASSVHAESCANGPTQLALTSWTSSPSPPCSGQPLCVTVKGDLSTDIVEGSTLSITARYLNRLVYTDNHQLCDLLAAQGTPCPLPASTTEAKVCVTVKPNAPPNIGADVYFNAVNGDGGVIWCEKTAGVKVKNC